MDLIGEKYGRLTVIEKIKVKYITKWKCICECGNKTIVRQNDLRSGHTKSCGCFSIENSSKNGLKNIFHGQARAKIRTKEFIAWQSMKDRCYNPNYHSFEHYGGRGIKVCEEWLNSFQTFFNYIGKSPGKEYSIDRIDNNGNYEPGNVKWSTIEEQNQNTSRNKIYWSKIGSKRKID